MTCARDCYWFTGQGPIPRCGGPAMCVDRVETPAPAPAALSDWQQAPGPVILGAPVADPGPLIKCPGCELELLERETAAQVAHMTQFHPGLIERRLAGIKER